MTAGGYQRPNNPAPVSGPGAQSKRTDGKVENTQAAKYLAGGDYGDGGLMGIQQGAPMSASVGAMGKLNASTNYPGGQYSPQEQVVPLTAPSQRPNEEVTHGAAAGPGGGNEVLGLPSQAQQGGTSAKQLIQGLASHPDASPALKQLDATLGR